QYFLECVLSPPDCLDGLTVDFSIRMRYKRFCAIWRHVVISKEIVNIKEFKNAESAQNFGELCLGVYFRNERYPKFDAPFNSIAWYKCRESFHYISDGFAI